MKAQSRYVARILEQYAKLPGTLGHILRQDRRTALDLYRRQREGHSVPTSTASSPSAASSTSFLSSTS